LRNGSIVYSKRGEKKNINVLTGGYLGKKPGRKHPIYNKKINYNCKMKAKGLK